MASLWLYVSLLLYFLVIPCWSKFGDIDEDCRKRLTELDSHMSAYVGTKWEVAIALASCLRIFFFLRHEIVEEGEYTYKIGVCVDMSSGDDNFDMCGAVQYRIKNHTRLSHCLGNVTRAQIARSKCLYLVQSSWKAISSLSRCWWCVDWAHVHKWW